MPPLSSRDAGPLSPWITQCDNDGELQTWARPMWHTSLCGFCTKPVADTDYLVFVSDADSKIGYPGVNARGFLTHQSCGFDVGYAINLARLADVGVKGDYTCDSLFGWRSHLRSKDWYSHTVDFALEDAHRLAAKFRAGRIAADRTVADRKSPAVQSPRVVVRLDNPDRGARSISPGQRARIMERDGFRCRRCGCGPTDDKLVVDHIVPVAKRGTAVMENLQTLCQKCNAGKSDRDPHDHDLSTGGATDG